MRKIQVVSLYLHPSPGEKEIASISHRLEVGKAFKILYNQNKQQLTTCSLKAGPGLVLEPRVVASGQNMNVRASGFIPCVIGKHGAF